MRDGDADQSSNAGSVDIYAAGHDEPSTRSRALRHEDFAPRRLGGYVPLDIAPRRSWWRRLTRRDR